MTEDNNVFSEFGARSAKFDELLKKYQTIDENGEVVPSSREQLSTQAVNTAEEPVGQPSADIASDCAKAEDTADPQSDYPCDTDDTTADKEAFDGLAEEDDDEVFGFFNAKPVGSPAAQPIAEPVKAVEENDDDEAFGFFNAEPVDSSAAQPIAEPEVSGGFVFDAQARFSEDSDEGDQGEPDYSYDINTFGKSKYGGALDIDSFDDSWLDTAFDESLFYRAKAVVDTYQVQAPAPESAQNDKFTQAQSNRDMYEISSEYEDFDVMPQSNVGGAKNVQMTGGYVAPSSLSDFEFDPDSGIDFGDDDGFQTEPNRSNRGSLVSKLKKKLRKKDL